MKYDKIINDLMYGNLAEKIAYKKGTTLTEANEFIAVLSFGQYLKLLEASADIIPPSGQKIGGTTQPNNQQGSQQTTPSTQEGTQPGNQSTTPPTQQVVGQDIPASNKVGKLVRDPVTGEMVPANQMGQPLNPLSAAPQPVSEDIIDGEVTAEMLDGYLKKLYTQVVVGKQFGGNHGMVAAGVFIPGQPFISRTSYQDQNGKWVHAERALLDVIYNQGMQIPNDAILITTLSPCNRMDDNAAINRAGDPCSILINDTGINYVYTGFIDTTQGHGSDDYRTYELIETRNQELRTKCEELASTFLDLGVDSDILRLQNLAGITEMGSSGAVGAGSVASVASPLGKVKRRSVTNEGPGANLAGMPKTIVGDTKPWQAIGELSSTLAKSGKKTASRNKNGMRRRYD